MSATEDGLRVQEISPTELPAQTRTVRLVKSAVTQVVSGIVAALAAFLLRRYITRFTGPLPPFIIYNPAVLLMALYVGVWSGLVVTVASAAIVAYWVLAPVGSLHVVHPSDEFALMHFIAVGVFTSVLSELYRNSQKRLARVQTEQAVREERRLAQEQAANAAILKQQADRLREAEQTLTTLVNLVPQIVWKSTPDGRNTFLNQRWTDYTGLSNEEGLGTEWGNALHPDDLPAVRNAWQKALRTGEDYQVEGRIRSADGTYRWFLTRGTPMRAEDGTVQRWFGTTTDIDDLKRAHEALIRSEKIAAVGRLTSSIAHEINNPLEAVMNILYLARTSPECTESQLELLVMAEEEVKRISQVTRQTLGFYRESAAPVHLPLTTIIDSAIDLHRRRITERDAAVRTIYRGDFSHTTIPGELRQVFSNLLANSLDAIERKGRVVLRVSRVPGTPDHKPILRIMFSDDGSGIEPRLMERIFEPLFTTKIATGSGLGLWVVRQLLEKHGARIQVRSCTSGAYRGTSFVLMLPEHEDCET